MSNLAERLANLEGALVAPMAVPNKKATISGEEFRRRMAEGKARAKAKRDAEKAGVSGAIGAKIAVPEAPLLQEHKEIPAVLMGSEAGRKEEAVKQSAEGAELRQESATGVPCPTCGTKVSADMLEQRREGLKRKVEIAEQIADQTKLSISVLEAMPPMAVPVAPKPVAPAPKPKLKDLNKEAVMALLDEFEETHDETDVNVFAPWIGTKFPGVPLSSLLKVADWAINEKYPDEEAPPPAPVAPPPPKPVAPPPPPPKPEGKVEPYDEKTLEAIRSIGQWAWRRFGGNEIKGQDYSFGTTTSFKCKGVKEMFPGYWPEWAPIVGKAVIWPTISLDYSGRKMSMVCVYADGSVSVEIPGKGDKDRADNWFEQSFGATLMNEPQDAVIADKDAPESAIKARLEEGKALKAKQEAEKQARWKKDDEVKEQRLAKLKEILVKVKGIIAEMETKRAEADKLAWKGKADYVKKLKKLYEEFKAQVIGNDRAFVQAFDAYYWNYRSHLVKEVIPDYKD